MARKILLADDSVTAQNMGRRILSDAGYDVTTVNNGSAALKKIAESKPDLIVLDVYMPGYGGLEVCQRLREAPETARIPVLLTVGKLEPFKADEARRVRADGFIVKPFEASELLTALTKLEDKIVPQSQPSRQSRFAKALAGVDDFTPSKEFGDSETGWKNRLSIPPPHSKPRESEPQEPAAAVASSHESAGSELPKPAEMKSGLEEALLSSMPQDVTAEEIAAIRAAAAAFSVPGNELDFKPNRDQADVSKQEPVIKAESAELVVSENPSTLAHAEISAAAEAPKSDEAVPVASVLAETVPPAAAISSESPASIVTEVVVEDAGKLAVDEVTAALASLAPANGHGDSSVTDRDADRWSLASHDQAPVTMAVAGSTQEFSGPRWVAESVAVMEDEAALVLEREMEKAYAAFAAADVAQSGFESSPESYVPELVAESPAANLETPSTPVESSPNSDSSEPKPPEVAVHAGREEAAMAEADTSVASAPAYVEVVGESVVSEVKETAAYAAAASAGAGASEVIMNTGTTTQSSPATDSSETVPAAAEYSGRQGESELAAAWANWKQIRESVVGSQLSSQIADAVAEVKENTQDNTSEARPESQPDASSAAADESSEISNIVDSVLADLKPRLMAEIAKKMGKEKKQ